MMFFSEAGKLIYFIYKDPVKGKKEKRDFDQNISLHEVFLEAVPTTVIITVIWFKEGRTIFRNGTFIDGPSEFLITYSLSITSASLGLAKCLKNGVARPIGAGGCLDGLLSARHLLAFFASGLCLIARGFCLGVAVASTIALVINSL